MAKLQLLLCAATAAAAAPLLPVKIVTGTPNPTPTLSIAVRPNPRREPAPLAGPASLAPLAGRCFATLSGIYTFELCAFANVTQRETHGGAASFFGILGVWRGWLPPAGAPARFATQVYDDGQDCPGAKRRVTHVGFACGPSDAPPRLLDAREPATCEYTLTLSCAEACGEGALLASAPTIAPPPEAAAAAVAGGGSGSRAFGHHSRRWRRSSSSPLGAVRRVKLEAYAQAAREPHLDLVLDQALALAEPCFYLLDHGITSTRGAFSAG
jgi:hypothetical protein